MNIPSFTVLDFLLTDLTSQENSIGHDVAPSTDFLKGEIEELKSKLAHALEKNCRYRALLASLGQMIGEEL